MTPVGNQKNDAHLSSEPKFSNLKRACKLISDIWSHKKSFHASLTARKRSAVIGIILSDQVLVVRTFWAIVIQVQLRVYVEKNDGSGLDKVSVAVCWGFWQRAQAFKYCTVFFGQSLVSGR